MLLAKDGIFPITRDQNGNLLSRLPASGLPIAGTIQGEGKLCGIPSLFVRLAGCNLRCCWKNKDGRLSPCDTVYAAYELQHTRNCPPEEVYRTILHNTDHIRHIVITGGEPFLQHKELIELCSKLKEENKYHLTIETNATVYQEELADFIDLFSMSPKLSASHTGYPPKQSTIQPSCIQSFIDHAHRKNKDFQLKFVYSCEEDVREIQQLLDILENWKNEDILLMPLGGNQEILRTNTIQVLEHCLRKGWRYCDRLHISLFGDEPGV